MITSTTRFETVGTVIGHYHLLRKLGEGGMGEVWLAEQREPVRRRVALKLIKAGMNNREVIARFESERQALALMEHPAIAKVLDGGSTLQGAPYFVMEFVAGLPITDYCDDHRLNTRERLELFMRVCEGVQHAHQKAIIHRDLKPSNILVTQVDDRPAPKIIDFGIAKALTYKLTAETMFTRVGAIVGTPEYMSPEQALSSGMDEDTRTDVYALGIIFFELLAGAPPLELKKIALEEFLRRLREDDTPTPSRKFRTQDAATSNELARKRQTESSKLVSQLRGDLDSIALKALQKDRARRYASPLEFAADVGRYLRNEAVLAMPPSPAYRARKFAHRYRAALITLSAFVLVLMLAAGVSIWQGVRASQQRDRADQEAAISKAVTKFLQDDLLSQADPGSQRGGAAPDPEVKVRSLLDRAAARVGQRFAKQPLVESDVRQTIGEAYRGLGLFPQADQNLRRAYDLSVSHRGADNPETLDLLLTLSQLAGEQGEKTKAVKEAKSAFEGEARTLGPENSKSVIAMDNLGAMYTLAGQYEKAEPLLTKALALQLRAQTYDNPEVLNTNEDLATLYIFRGEYTKAHDLYTKGLASYQRVYGPEHPFTYREMFGLGQVAKQLGNYTSAEELLSKVLAANKQAYGPKHRNYFYTAESLGEVYADEGKFAQGISLLQETVEGFGALFGRGSLTRFIAARYLGRAYELSGDSIRAQQVYEEALRSYQLPNGQVDAYTVGVWELLAHSLMEQHTYKRAESMLRQALAFRERNNRNEWTRFRAQALLGTDLADQKRYSEAEPLLLAGYSGMKQRASNMGAIEKRWIRESGKQLVEMYVAWPKPDRAAAWRATLNAQ